MIISIVVSIAIAVLIHEVGHLIAAKLVHLDVTKMEIGLGPVIFKRSNPVCGAFTIRLIPLAGSCEIIGEDFKLSDIDKNRGRLVLAGGFIFNFVIAILASVIAIIWSSSSSLLIISIEMNFILSILNFLPIIKNDGWRILNTWK